MKKTAMALLLGLVPACLFAGDPGSAFKTRSISVFKNGTAFFRKTGTLDAGTGTVLLTDLSIAAPKPEEDPSPQISPFLSGSYRYSQLDVQLKQAAFGSIWFFSPDNPLLGVSRFESEVEQHKPVASIPEMLRNNEGVPVQVMIRDRQDPVRSDSWSITGNFMVLESGGKWITSTLADIRQVDFFQAPKMQHQVSQRQNVLRLDFAEKRTAQAVELMYLQNGLHWVPNYLVELLDDQKARVTLRATVINDVEDIENVEISFVAGVPNLKYAQVSSPLSSNQSVADFMNALYHGRSPSQAGLGGNLSTSIFSNALVTDNFQLYTTQDATALAPIFNVQPEGAMEDDLYFYKVQDFSLPKNGRAFVNLLETSTTYERIHSVTLPSNTGYGFDRRKNSVSTTIRFRNNTEMPFTTGAATVVSRKNKDLRPLAQNQLNYTPPGLRAYVQTSMATEVGVFDEEIEIDPSGTAVRGWTLRTFEGVIDISNLDDKPISLEIKRSIEGELISSDHPWEKDSRLKRYDAKNRHNEVCWNVELPGGEKKKITYRYKIWVEN